MPVTGRGGTRGEEFGHDAKVPQVRNGKRGDGATV
jgi:hypothetical protein